MDLVLHKKLLTLQQENCILKEEIQKIKEKIKKSSEQPNHFVKKMDSMFGLNDGTHTTLHHHNGSHYVVKTSQVGGHVHTGIYHSDENGNHSLETVGGSTRLLHIPTPIDLHSHNMEQFTEFTKSKK